MTGGAGRADASGDRSVAAGGAIGRVNTGDFVTQVENATLLPPEALTVSPAGLVHLPERTQLFVGRARELALLDEGVGIQVLCGLGGIGKSTLAARWAADRVADHTVVWWITAETPAELDAGLADLARAMQPGVVGVLPEDALRERALQWLATNDDWLLVLDNVSAPADLRPLLARVGNGRIVVTSRRASGWQDIARTVVLDVLGPAEAAELFTGVCASDDGLDALCGELGYLPLALKQAAAYCAEAGITPRAYLGLLAEYPGEMFAATAEGGEAARTISRVWQVTLDRLQDTPLAGRILGVLAWWAPEGIPRRLLEPLGTPLEVTEAVRRLRAHSMITLDSAAIEVHRMVQAVVRAGDGGEGRDAAEKLLARMVRASQGDLFANVDVWRPYAIQVLAFAGYTDPDEDTAGRCVLFNWAAFVFGLTTDGRSLALHARALLGYRRLYGAEDERSLNALGGLVLEMQQHGAPPELGGLHEEHFELHARLYGPDDPRTIAARAHLAKTLMRSSRHRAEELLRENVDRAARSLGEDDPETLGARRALLYADPDRSAACSGLELLLARSREVLPEGHGVIDGIAGSLTTVLLELGRAERALELAEAAAEGVSARHGPNHPRTLMRRGFHVYVLAEAGEIDRARSLAKDLLDDCESAMKGTLLTTMVRQLARKRLSLGD
ncbi:tetratricopeptide repeat protein [Streptomyces gardneri]|uniref:tetratricopeptide repeat protein n=1 Tax=Streptomyces gardneri TaxID=66892 RepID=UPI0036B03347